MTGRQNGIWPLAGFVVVMWLAAWLGLSRLGVGMLWYDEWWSFWSAGGGSYGPITFAEMMDRAMQDASQPPVYYAMLWAWGGVAGWSPFAARFLSFMFGLLTLAWTYRLGVDISRRREVGLLAAALLATSAIFIDYLHELRLYTMMTLFSTMLVAVYWRLARTDERPDGIALILLFFAIVGVVYSHLLTALTLAAVGLYHLLTIRRAFAWVMVFSVMAVAGLTYVPWLGMTLNAVTGFVDHGGRVDTRMTGAAVLWHVAFALSNGTFLLIGLLAFGRPTADAHRRPSRFLWAVFGLIVLQGLILNALAGVLTHARYLLALWPLAAVIVAVGLMRWRRPALIAVIVGAWAGAGLYHTFTPDFSAVLFREVHERQFRPGLPLDRFGAMVRAEGVAGDVAVLHVPVASWSVGGGFHVAIHGTSARYAILDHLAGDDAERDAYLPEMAFLLGDAGRVWLGMELNVGTTERLTAFMETMGDDYLLCGRRFDSDELAVDLYARPGLCDMPDSPFHAFDERVHLLAWSARPATDDRLELVTAWRGDVPPDTYSVGVYVFDAGGDLVLQGDDFPLPVGGYGYNVQFLPLDELDAGAYTLTVAVYDWRTGERLPAELPRQDVALGAFDVVD